MHNLYTILAKFLNICKQISGNLVNEHGNIPRLGVIPKFSDVEIIALNMTSEAIGIDSEFFFGKARKRIETLFSQLSDQFMIIRNYAKDTERLYLPES
ncbi:hypothetical protein IX321_002778 [Bacteroides pyogenes]|nr:hypothetical protein [Bacteroides pyogenes]MBR8718851.1 hypothetical protein [Bacteroides pyogenes]MBR8748318.1 hypothetical protein [Bacteroides pyogenes]MBR8758594.1 hypothetical protein [Bacteroides pyogenes]MBR8781823.1 hypothetical protein [Bacteroides pyogenes]